MLMLQKETNGRVFYYSINAGHLKVHAIEEREEKVTRPGFQHERPYSKFLHVVTTIHIARALTQGATGSRESQATVIPIRLSRKE